MKEDLELFVRTVDLRLEIWTVKSIKLYEFLVTTPGRTSKPIFQNVSNNYNGFNLLSWLSISGIGKTVTRKYLLPNNGNKYFIGVVCFYVRTSVYVNETVIIV